MLLNSLQKAIFSADRHNFEALAMEVFRYQSEHCEVYRQYLQYLQTDLTKINKPEEIPYLPIEFFKYFSVMSGSYAPEKVFESSSTTGIGTSRHAVRSLSLYEESFTKSFSKMFGAADEYCHLALLPAYLERENSSLIYQTDYFIRHSKYKESGFYLYDHPALARQIKHNEAHAIPTILWGVTFALLDFAENYNFELKHTLIIETGGMKGRRKEIVRRELHHILEKAFGTPAIAGEYGMTELMSQAYSAANGIYHCPPWMRVSGREINDPFAIASPGKNAVLNVIDLANLHTCSFIATSDITRIGGNCEFEILGRLDQSDTRGCNLLI